MSSESVYQRQCEIMSRSNINANKNKTARIKLKPFEKINIYNIFMIKILTDMSDKLYLYVDDRTSDAQIVQKMIDDIFNTLRKFNVKIPDIVIRYTDYYETAWVYLHRLVQMRETLLNYNSTQRADDLHALLKNNKMAIFLVQDPNDTESKTRYDNILYDNGWFRDIFIEAIIDDAEKIDYKLDDNGSKMIKNDNIGSNRIIDTQMPSAGDFVKINKTITTRLCDILKFNRPACVLTNITDNVENLKYWKNNVDPVDTSPTLNDLSLEQILDMGLDLKHVREMIENHDVSLKKYMICCDDSETLLSASGIQCMIDPIKIKMNEIRSVDINGSHRSKLYT